MYLVDIINEIITNELFSLAKRYVLFTRYNIKESYLSQCFLTAFYD